MFNFHIIKLLKISPLILVSFFVASLAAENLSIKNFSEEYLAASTRGGISSVGASVTLSFMKGGIQAAPLWALISSQVGGGRSLGLHSTYAPTSVFGNSFNFSYPKVYDAKKLEKL